jgi:hypothetical protein
MSLLGAVSATADTITTVRVGERYRGDIDFSVVPSMSLIPDTRVYYIRDDTDYDLYRYNGSWYLVDNGNWYRASSWRGPFRNIRLTTVPRAVTTIPTGYRKTWSAVRETRTPERYRGAAISFRSEPRMSLIPRTRVYYIQNGSDNDVYRFGNTWYYVEDGDWYRASSWRGPFEYMRWSELPQPIRNVPMSYRRTWTYSSGPRTRDYRDEDRPASRMVVGYGGRYRGSVIFDREPRMPIIPGTDVYYMRDESDYDLYRYGNAWYLVDNGDWYRATSWRGPFIRIRRSAVPEAVYRIPSGYRKTWVPGID